LPGCGNTGCNGWELHGPELSGPDRITQQQPHEISQDEYLGMKRKEIERQNAPGEADAG
jgi:hypothetical protein